MTERTPAGDEQPMDLAPVAGDDLLLDALGRGDEPPAGDGLAVMLGAWRAEVDADEAAPTGDVEPIRTAVAALGDPEPGRDPDRTRRSWWVGRQAPRLAAAAIAIVGLTTGLAVGSQHAGPTSPLWSLTKVLYPEQAEVRGVEYTIDRARSALAAGRFDEARALIDDARSHLPRIADPATAARLGAELDALSRELPAATPAPPPANQPTPPTPSSGPVATSGPAATEAPAPAPPPASGRNDQPPIIPVPSLPPPPAPIPSLLPTPLPGLSLPTGPLLG